MGTGSYKVLSKREDIITFSDMLVSYGEELLVPLPTHKMEVVKYKIFQQQAE
jgi:hypothetical protein